MLFDPNTTLLGPRRCSHPHTGAMSDNRVIRRRIEAVDYESGLPPIDTNCCITACAEKRQLTTISNNDQRAIAPIAHLGLLRVRELGRRVFATRNRHNELHCSSALAVRKRGDITTVALDDHFANA